MSRKRGGGRYFANQSALFHGGLAIDKMYDRVVSDGYDKSAPPTVYHYTSWNGASGILRSQRFWATAHQCTNDRAELKSADAVILEVAEEVRKGQENVLAREALRLFITGFHDLGMKVGSLLTVCLACFSASRDDAEQWKRYGDYGRGLMLGIRVVNEPAPTDYTAATVKVDYDEKSWRDTITESFRDICKILSQGRALPSQENLELALNALHRIAAHASIQAKKTEWAVEQEYRRVVLLRDPSKLQKRPSATGEEILYLPTLVREDGKRILLDEITIGPNQDVKDACEKLEKLLTECGYVPGTPEYPKITISCAPPTSPSEFTNTYEP
jgi:hypothetical protein